MSNLTQKTAISSPAELTHDNRIGGIENAGMTPSWESDDNRADAGFIEWRVHPRFTSYEVSNTGQLRRCTAGPRTHIGKIVAQYVDKSGYLRTCLFHEGRKERRLVHQLVADAFIGEKPAGMTVDHIDGDKINNHALNLEYVSRGENIKRAFAMGKYRFCRGENQATAKLTDAKVAEIKRLLPTMNNCAIARIYGVSDVAIRKIRLGKTWKHVA